MDVEGPSMECEVCGGTDFYKETGHFYCKECQTQSQQVQDHVFDREEITINKKTTKKIQKEKLEKTGDMLTSWECYTYVLKGLTDELLVLGAKAELSSVVRCLWMKYLHKNEVFDVNSDRPPKVSLLGPKKDVAILYNIKKRKRSRSRASSTSTILSEKRRRSARKRALIQSQYEKLSQSQTLTQDSSLNAETLSSLKSGSETSENSGKIHYNRYSSSELRRMMSRNHRQKHLKDVEGELTCHRFRARSFRTNFITGPSNLTTFTLYCILYISLLIIEDSIQLGDMLRFIRESHLSFGCYRHFFDEALSDKTLTLSQRKEKLFSHGIFRKRCAKVAQFLEVSSYIERPDLIALSARYCTELNLPNEVFECVKKLIIKTNPKMAFNKASKMIPNYEGRVMSFILIVLKLLFGLDGVTEQRFSDYADVLNGASDNVKMFNIMTWLQFVEYRAEIMRIHHLPLALKDCVSVDSDMYLSYLKKQEVKFKGTIRHVHGEVKDYLQVLDKLLEGLDQNCENDDLKCEPFLTPYATYSKLILDNKDVVCGNILQESFQGDSLSFLLHPHKYLELMGVQQVKNGGANDKIITEDLLHLYRATISAQRKGSRPVAVKISHDIADDIFVDEFLEVEGRKSLKTSDVGVLLSNWQNGNEKEFAINKELSLKADNGSVDIESKILFKGYREHYNAFERYWMNVPMNPVAHYFPKHEMEPIFNKFPHSFRIIMTECSRIVEQDTCDLFSEFLMTELYLTNFAEFGCKPKKNKGKGVPEMRALLNNCKKHW